METQTGRSVEIKKDISEKEHFHGGLEVIFLIEGGLTVRLGERSYPLQKEDVVAVDPGLPHSLESVPGTILCRIFYPGRMLAELLGDRSVRFHCNSAVDGEHSYRELRKICRELVYEEVMQTRKTRCRMESLFYQLLDCLTGYFQVEDKLTDHGKLEEEERLQLILRFVDMHYGDDISLSELAKRFYVSTSTLSRFFKKQTGIYFAEYIKRVRCEAARRRLLHTDQSVTKIALDHGYSTLSAFNRAFQDIYGMTPTDYREQQKESVRKKKEEEEHLRGLLLQELKRKELIPAVGSGGQAIKIFADGRGGQPYEKSWAKVINIGSADQLFQANLQFHTEYLAEQLGFQYARIWSIFSKKMMLTDGKRIGGYNYDQLDNVLDLLVSRHIHPFLELTKRPDTAVKGELDTVYFEDGYIGFSSRRAWEALIEDLIGHVVRRYGQEEVDSWIFELGYDRCHPGQADLYTDPDGPFDYMDAFFFLYQTVKKLAPKAQVGGPMAIADHDIPFQRYFFVQCKERGCIPDFVSYMLYPYVSVQEGGVVFSRRSGREEVEREFLEQIQSLMQECGLGTCPLYITEWTNSVSNRNYLNDSCFRGAYLARKVAQIGDMAELFCFRNGSDWVGSYYDTSQVANGNLGLITKSGIRKPVFFVMDLLNHLGDLMIGRGDHYIITRTHHYSYYILCFNYKWFSSNYFLSEEYMDSPRQLKDFFEDLDPVELEIVLEGVPGQQYVVKKRSVNEQVGSILGEWERLQYEPVLDGSDVRYLRETCFPRLSMEKLEAKEGTLKIRTVCQAHEVVLLHIYEAR